MNRKILLLFALFPITSLMAQDSNSTFFNPFLNFNVGITGHSINNIAKDLREYSGTNQNMSGSCQLGLSAGILIGKKHKLALTYSTSIQGRQEYVVDMDIFSSGFWYEYKAFKLKNKDVFLRLGFRESIATIHVSKNSTNPPNFNNSFKDFLEVDSNCSIMKFEQWTNGIDISALYSFFDSQSIKIKGQLGYLLNFDHGQWQYLHNNLERKQKSKLPNDTLNGFFLKVVVELNLKSLKRIKL